MRDAIINYSKHLIMVSHGAVAQTHVHTHTDIPQACQTVPLKADIERETDGCKGEYRHGITVALLCVWTFSPTNITQKIR